MQKLEIPREQRSWRGKKCPEHMIMRRQKLCCGYFQCAAPAEPGTAGEPWDCLGVGARVLPPGEGLEQIHRDASHLGHNAHQLQNYNLVVMKVQERRCWAGSFTQASWQDPTMLQVSPAPRQRTAALLPETVSACTGHFI